MFSQEFSDNENEDEDESSSCSEDELEKYIKKKYNLQDEKNNKSDDDFESEMESQLETRFRFLEQTEILKKAPLCVAQSIRSSNPVKKPSKGDVIQYDVDSDDSEDGENNENNPEQSNEELLYDPNKDDKDQEWMDKQRKKYLQPSGSQTVQGKKLNSSDAALNCPACMTLLCMDCQRHEIYNTQYRAMFVLNCEVDTSQTVEPREKASSRKRQRVRGGSRHMSEEVFHPVKCTVCGTEVAAYDSDEVYHFYNIIASYV